MRQSPTQDCNSEKHKEEKEKEENAEEKGENQARCTKLFLGTAEREGSVTMTR